MLIPLTDPEHPLSRQMLQLIADHQARPEKIQTRPVVDHPDDVWVRRGRTVAARLRAQRVAAAAAMPVI